MHSTHRYPAPGPAGGQNQAKIPPAKSLKRRLKRYLPNKFQATPDFKGIKTGYSPKFWTVLA